MKATPLAIPDVMLIEPTVFGDDRGFFFESYNQRQFEEAVGRKVMFVRTTIPVRKRACCAVCTIKSSNPRAS